MTPEPVHLVLTVPQLITLIIAVLGSFTGIFFALQRYVGSKVDGGLERFDKHATKLEEKLDKVVEGLGRLNVSMTGLKERHEGRLNALDDRLDRTQRQVDSLRGGEG